MRWKWILGLPVVLLLALTGTIYIVLASYDFDDFKPRIAKAVKDATGRELSLAGRMTLDLGLTPALVVENASFQNAPWGSRPELAKIRRLEVQVGLLPLLRGTMEVKRLILVEPDILLETDTQGKSNLDFETPAKAAPTKPQKEPPAARREMSFLALAFNEVAIRNGRLAFKDGKSGRLYALALEHLVATAEGDHLVSLKLHGAYNHTPCKIEGTFGSLAVLTDPEKAWPVRMTAEAVGTTVSVDGTVRDALTGRGLDLAVTGRGSSVPDLLKLFNVDDVPDVGPYRVAGTLTDPEGRLTVTDLDLTVGTEKLAKVALQGTVKDLLAFSGMDLSFVVQGEKLAHLEGLAGRPIPSHGPFHMSGKVMVLSPETYELSELDISLPEGDLSGTVRISLAGKRPAVEAELSSRKLDVRPFLEKQGAENESEEPLPTPETPGPPRKKIFPQDPLPLEWLKQADGEMTLAAQELVLPLLLLKDVTAHALLRDGNLAVNPFTGVAGEGTMDGRMELASRNDGVHMNVALKVDRFDVGKMLKELGIVDVLEGKLEIDLDLSGRGDSVAGVLAGLNGKALVIVGEGRINDQFISLLGGDLGQSLFRLLSPSKESSEFTDVNCLVMGLDVREGLAKSTVLLLDTSNVNVVGHGKIDLKTEALDLVLKPSPKRGVGIKGLGKFSLSLGELTKPLKLSGTLANPTVGVDPSGTLFTLGKAIGGVALLGPVGLAAALAGGKLGDEDPCMLAIQEARNCLKEPEAGEAVKKEGGIKGITEGISSGLKKLFGK